ncbi:MAG: 2Fe-2S iron-sulfur cluster-binding protein [Miniphocaeibacter sp.]|uniref:(2Fe-2S)-binding protein n=1 Tax=Miniphocaeibacter sp. TaxID=3100973 RepID=UPI0018422323|nr:2Fe-2S iron-sulfur cluster binding domain-containing protein [Gallicola sp.]
MELLVNNKKYNIDISPGEKLLDTLRRLGFNSVRRGCNTASCCVCTVIVDRKPVLSCSYLTNRASGKEIFTVEGFGDKARKIASLLAEEGADQCGYCGPALINTIIGLEFENDKPTIDEINDSLKANLCRCTGYQGQLRAIEKYFNI